MICPICKGIGSIPGFWLGSIKTCTSCHGKGILMGESFELRVRSLEQQMEMVDEILKDIIKLLGNERKAI